MKVLELCRVFHNLLIDFFRGNPYNIEDRMRRNKMDQNQNRNQDPNNNGSKNKKETRLR